MQPWERKETTLSKKFRKGIISDMEGREGEKADQELTLREGRSSHRQIRSASGLR